MIVDKSGSRDASLEENMLYPRRQFDKRGGLDLARTDEAFALLYQYGKDLFSLRTWPTEVLPVCKVESTLCAAKFGPGANMLSRSWQHSSFVPAWRWAQEIT